MLATVVEVDVVGAYCCCPYEFHLAAIQQSTVAAGAGASEQDLSIAHDVTRYLRSWHIEHLLSHGLKQSFQEGDFAVGNYFHQAITIAMI